MKTKNITLKAGKLLSKTKQAVQVTPCTKVIRFKTDDPNWRNYTNTSDQYGVFQFEEGTATEEKINHVNGIIAETIQKTGIDSFEGTNLYEITYETELKKAIDLINHGVAKQGDYPGKMFKGYTALHLMMTRLKERVNDDPDGALSRLARSISNSQEEYDHYFYIFSSYKRGIRESLEITAKIDGFAKAYGTDTYMGFSLYDAEKEETVLEAGRAFKKAANLTAKYGVTAYNGAALNTLSEYELDGLEEKIGAGNFGGCEIDKTLVKNVAVGVSNERAAHNIKIKPATEKIENFLAEKRYGKAASQLSFMLRKNDLRAVVEDFYDYKALCKEMLLLLTDAEISGRLPKKMQKKAGKRLYRMVDFFGSIAESEAVQAEMDLLYIGRIDTDDEQIAVVLEDYNGN